MPQNEQADPGEVEVRLEYMRGLIAQGMKLAQIVEHVETETAWGVKPRQIRNYYYAVWKEYSNEATGVDRAAYFVRTIDRLDHIYGAAMTKGDFKAALTATVELARLLRLDIPNADFDWKAAAKQAGIAPSDLFERVVQAVQAEDELKHGDALETE